MKVMTQSKYAEPYCPMLLLSSENPPVATVSKVWTSDSKGSSPQGEAAPFQRSQERVHAQVDGSLLNPRSYFS